MSASLTPAAPHDVRVAAMSALLHADLDRYTTRADIARHALDALDRAGVLPVAEQAIDQGDGSSRRWVGPWREPIE